MSNFADYNILKVMAEIKYKIVDLFAGAGGLSTGLLKIRVIKMIKYMKRVPSLLLLIAFVSSCGNNQNNTRAEMNEKEFQEFNEAKSQEGMIAIETTFEPTLELTDEIKNSTLEELIRQGKGKFSKDDQAKCEAYMSENKRKMKGEGISDEFIEFISQLETCYEPVSPSDVDANRGYTLKYVPKTTNLAKVYYLEDMKKFIKHNRIFYNNIIRKMQEDSQGQDEQKNWDKYLN